MKTFLAKGKVVIASSVKEVIGGSSSKPKEDFVSTIKKLVQVLDKVVRNKNLTFYLDGDEVSLEVSVNGNSLYVTKHSKLSESELNNWLKKVEKGFNTPFYLNDVEICVGEKTNDKEWQEILTALGPVEKSNDYLGFSFFHRKFNSLDSIKKFIKANS